MADRVLAGILLLVTLVYGMIAFPRRALCKPNDQRVARWHGEPAVSQRGFVAAPEYLCAAQGPAVAIEKRRRLMPARGVDDPQIAPGITLMKAYLQGRIGAQRMPRLAGEG